jgi:hypothetical protein
MKALSVVQPRASLIVLGLLPIETLTWGSRYTGPLAIHAAKRDTVAQAAIVERLFKHPAALHVLLKGLKRGSLGEVRHDLESFPVAAVVGTVTLADCVPIRHPSEFTGFLERAICDLKPGRIEWFFHRARSFETPVPDDGAPGLWEWAPARSKE